jgi:hypothetical protein
LPAPMVLSIDQLSSKNIGSDDAMMVDGWRCNHAVGTTGCDVTRESKSWDS